MDQSIELILEQVFQDRIEKAVLSKPKDREMHFQKISVQILEKQNKEVGYQIARYTKTQVFHENIAAEELRELLVREIGSGFRQINLFGDAAEHIILISSKGMARYTKKMKTKAKDKPVERRAEASDAELSGEGIGTGNLHNRKKRYLIPEGEVILPLIDMGIFTKDGMVVRKMYDKYRQINRCIELIEDGLKAGVGSRLNIVDFGCGKSYLTFILYHYLAEIRGIEAYILGLDLKAEVVRECNVAAKKYGYKNLEFQVGDIADFSPPFSVDMVITLHACDTATDLALYHAQNWGARMIYSIPCCQHEFRSSMQGEDIFSRYGIIQERFAALATDAIRANLLECCGYRAQLLEFVDFDHTPKNILIRAVRKGMVSKTRREKLLGEAEELLQKYGAKNTLYDMLRHDQKI